MRRISRHQWLLRLCAQPRHCRPNLFIFDVCLVMHLHDIYLAKSFALNLERTGEQWRHLII
jgi:hypothetical protein